MASSPERASELTVSLIFCRLQILKTREVVCRNLALVWSFPDTAVRSDGARDNCGDRADSWAPDQVS